MATYTRLLMRGKTTALWASLNEVLMDREIGVTTDTVPRKFKIGDGVTAWNALPFALDLTGITTGIGNADPTTIPDASITTYNLNSAGTYANLGGIVVSSGDLAAGIVQGRKTNGGWSKVIIPIDLTNYAVKSDVILNWTAQSFAAGAKVNYLGVDWVAMSSTTATDIPGSSFKWANRLSAYEGVETSLSENLLHFKGAVVGLLDATGGIITNQTSYYTSDFLPATAGKYYKLYIGSISPYTRMAFYNSSGSLVLYSDTAPGSYPQAPANTKYIRVSLLTNAVSTAFLKESTEAVVPVPAAYVPGGYILNGGRKPLYAGSDFILPALDKTVVKNRIIAGIQTVDSWVKPNNLNFLTQKINLVNLYDSRSIKTGYITGGGVVSTSGSPTQQLNYVNVKPNTAYSQFSGANPVRETNYVLCVDAAGGLSDIANKSTFSTDGYAMTKADTVMIVYTTLQPQYQPYYMLIEGTASPAQFVNYGFSFADFVELKDANVYPWDGKKAGRLGDSITVQSQYAAAMLAMTRMSDGYVEGQNGQVISVMGTGLTAANIANLDIITVLAGTNDYGHGGATLGTINSPIDGTTIHGSIKLVAQRVFSLKPNIPLVFFTPFNRGIYSGEGNGYTPNTNGLTIKNIAEAIIDECRFLGLPCYDLLTNSGINSYNLVTHCPDNLHPGAYGGALLGKKMGKFLNTLTPF